MLLQGKVGASALQELGVLKGLLPKHIMGFCKGLAVTVPGLSPSGAEEFVEPGGHTVEYPALALALLE